MKYLLKGPLVHTCAFAQIQQLCSRKQLVCSQLDVHLPYLTDCGRDKITGQVRGLGQVGKVPAGNCSPQSAPMSVNCL